MRNSIIIGALALSCAFVSCQKEDIKTEDTVEQVTNPDNETQYRYHVTEDGTFVSSVDEWLMLEQWWLFWVDYPGANENRGYFDANKEDLYLPFGEERVDNVIHGLWTVSAAGLLEVDEVLTVYFRENGVLKNEFRITTIEE